VSSGTQSAPRILATNDDGFGAPGLEALVRAMEPLGEVVVVAPDRERSGASHALTLGRPLRVWEAAKNRYRVDGTPTDCVHLGAFHLAGGEGPDLVVSGINRGVNVSDDVTYSGTVAGALEGTLLRVPSLAFSVDIDERGECDYDPAVRFARSLAERVLAQGLERGVFLNVNLPVGEPRGVRVCRQGARSYRAAVVERIDPAGRPYYWIADADTTPADEPDGDQQAIRDGYVSVTPLHADMTHTPSLDKLTAWNMEAS
jgi:5'-nucleotidase